MPRGYRPQVHRPRGVNFRKAVGSIYSGGSLKNTNSNINMGGYTYAMGHDGVFKYYRGVPYKMEQPTRILKFPVPVRRKNKRGVPYMGAANKYVLLYQSSTGELYTRTTVPKKIAVALSDYYGVPIEEMSSQQAHDFGFYRRTGPVRRGTALTQEQVNARGYVYDGNQNYTFSANNFNKEQLYDIYPGTQNRLVVSNDIRRPMSSSSSSSLVGSGRYATFM